MTWKRSALLAGITPWILAASAGLAAEPVAARGSRPWVTAYYAAWFWDGSPPDKLDVTAMTHLVFGRVAPGGGTLGGAPASVVFGAGSAGDRRVGPGAPNRSVEDYLIAKAHAAGTKVLLMLGGAGDGMGFVKSTEEPERRSTFVRNVVDYLVAHDYDGVDVDWEDALDSDGHRSLLLSLLTELRAEGARRPRYGPPREPILITFPGYALNVNVDLPVPSWKVTVASLVDQYNLMSYALGGFYPGWKTWFFCPISGASPATPYSLESTVDAYAKAGVPRAKIGIGIGLYGMNYAPQPAWAANTGYPANALVLKGIGVYRSTRPCISGVTGPAGNGRAIVDGSCRWDFLDEMGPRRPLDTSGGYHLQSNDIEWTAAIIALKYRGAGQYRWDDVAQQGYLLFPDGYQPPPDHKTYSRAGYLSFEDERSIEAKAQWVKRTGVGGAIIWTINYGVEDARTGANPLLDAVKKSFRR
jgi:chitinase